MANRYPLIIDTTDGNKIKELPNGDSLNLTGNAIVGVSNITSTGALSVASIAAEGNIAAGGNISSPANITAGDFLISGVSVLNSVDYADLLNKPSLADVATTGEYEDILNKPIFAAVATSGSYVDLSNTPLIPTDIAQLTDESGLLGSGGASAFTDLADTPDEYTGFANQFVQVNATENGLQFATVDTTITDGEIVAALGYVPYDASNPDGYINNSSGIVTALGFTPYADSNPAGYINDSVGIIDALTYIPYDASNPDGYLTSITSANVTTALGFTPYPDTNPTGFISDSAGVISALGYTPYNGDTNPNGYLTAEADTLESVTGRGATSTVSITAAGFTTTGNMSTANITISSAITFTSTGTISIDGGAGSTVVVGGTSNVSLRDTSGNIDLQAGLIPNVGATYNLGSSGSTFANGYFGSTVTSADFATNAASSTFSLQGSMLIQPAATGRVGVSQGVFKLPVITTTARNAISAQDGDIIFNNTLFLPEFRQNSQWRPITPIAGAEPTNPWLGMMAVANGTSWDPAGTGNECLMCYLNGAWQIIAEGA